jgi:hypothetical protein
MTALLERVKLAEFQIDPLPYKAKNYLGKDCILEIGERRLSMFITHPNGAIGHPPQGVLKGFPGLADQGQ